MKLMPEEEQARVEAIFMRRSKILQALDFEINELTELENEQRATVASLLKALNTVEAKLAAAEDTLTTIENETNAFEEAYQLLSEFAAEP